MILLALPAICLIHCAKPAGATTLENATGQDVRVEVTYRGSENRTVALVAAASAMPLQSPADQIEAIRYAYPDHACVLTHDQITAATHAGKGGKTLVTLAPCG